MSTRSEPERIYFWDLPKDAFEAFLDVREELESFRETGEDDSNIVDEISMRKAASFVEENLEKFPSLAFVVNEYDQSLLAMCMVAILLATDVCTDQSPCLSIWQRLVNKLIVANPHALTWTIEKNKSILDPLTTGQPFLNCMANVIVRNYIWVFGSVKGDCRDVNVYKGRVFDPAARLMLLHIHGYAPAWAVLNYCKMFPQKLYYQPHFGNLLLCALNTGFGSNVCSSKLFIAMAKQVPEAMMKKDSDGRTPLHLACIGLTGEEWPIHSHAAPDLAEICLFLIDECTEAIFTRDDAKLTPLEHLAADGYGDRIAKHVTIAMIKKIHAVSPGCTLPVAKMKLPRNANFIVDVDHIVRKKALLDLEMQKLMIAPGMLRSYDDHVLTQVYASWARTRMEAIMRINLDEVVVEQRIERALSMFYGYRTDLDYLADPSLTWHSYRYNPTVDWSHLSS